MPRHDFSECVQKYIQCFFDMSMHDAYIVSSISPTSLRKFMKLSGEKDWPFERIKHNAYKLGWGDIEALRNDVISKTVGVAHDIMVKAAKIGNVRRKIFEKSLEQTMLESTQRKPVKKSKPRSNPPPSPVARDGPPQQGSQEAPGLMSQSGEAQWKKPTFESTLTGEVYVPPSEGGGFTNLFGEPIDPMTGEVLETDWETSNIFDDI